MNALNEHFGVIIEADAAPRPGPSAGELGHPLEKLAEWFETVNQKITNADAGRQPPSYAELWEDIQHGLRHVGYLLTLADPPVAAPPETPRELSSEDIERRYYELLYEVAQKWPGETRHDTALRYIRQAERGSGDQCSAKATAPRPRPEEPTR